MKVEKYDIECLQVNMLTKVLLIISPVVIVLFKSIFTELFLGFFGYDDSPNPSRIIEDLLSLPLDYLFVVIVDIIPKMIRSFRIYSDAMNVIFGAGWDFSRDVAKYLGIFEVLFALIILSSIVKRLSLSKLHSHNSIWIVYAVVNYIVSFGLTYFYIFKWAE